MAPPTESKQYFLNSMDRWMLKKYLSKIFVDYAHSYRIKLQVIISAWNLIAFSETSATLIKSGMY